MSASLRVLSWNLWWRFGDWQRRHTAIATALANAQPDLVGLQEVWTADDVNQAELLARDLGMCWALAPSPSPGRWQRRIEDDSVGFANAVLSRWPLTREETVVLPAPAGHPPARTLLCTEARTPRGPVPFFTTQLDSAPDGSATRVAQVTEVARRLAAWPAVGCPPVLTGDLNAEPDSDELRLLGGHTTAPAVPGMVLLDAWLSADPQDRGLTWHLDNPHAAAQGPVSARIDYVMTGIPAANGRGRVRGVAMVGDRPVAECGPPTMRASSPTCRGRTPRSPTRERPREPLLRLRGSDHDRELREYRIDGTGLHIRVPSATPPASFPAALLNIAPRDDAPA